MSEKGDGGRTAFLSYVAGNASAWEALISALPSGVLIIDRSQIVRDCNRTMLEWLESEKQDILGQNCHALLCRYAITSRDAGKDTLPFNLFDAALPLEPAELRIQAPTGKIQHMQIRTCRIVDALDNPEYVVAFFEDITSQKLIKAYKEEAALRDTLTDLGNRRAFHDALCRELKRAQRQKHPLCLCLLDADSFKDYNEKKGEDEGDELLRKIANVMLRNTRREVDGVFRIVADSFALILPETVHDVVVRIGERISKAVKEIQPSITFSMSVCQLQQGEEASDLYHRAEDVLFQVKKTGGNRIM